jgi:hypothetical protein
MAVLAIVEKRAHANNRERLLLLNRPLHLIEYKDESIFFLSLKMATDLIGINNTEGGISSVVTIRRQLNS